MPNYKDGNRYPGYLPAEDPPVTPEEEEAFRVLTNAAETLKAAQDLAVFGLGAMLLKTDGSVEHLPLKDIPLDLRDWSSMT